MEPLVKQLRELPSRFGALSNVAKIAILASVAGLVAIGLAFSASSSDSWQYAFTNLTTEDSSEAAAQLKAAGVPFRLEAGGSALAVPANKVYDARLLLAGAGLPRGGGVGFELFDRGDLGVSEFTQQVNLRRAIEGELARTISRLSPVRSARVHLTLSEKGLFKDEDRKAAAAVVLNLQPGRTLDEREVAGIRHLIASAVPGLQPSGVTLLDGKGNALSAETSWGEANAFQRKLEHDLEQRIVELLGQAVGPGAVVARVTAQVDSAEVSTNAETVDPEATALRSERVVVQTQNQDGNAPGGVAGAAANQPLQTPAQANGASNRGSAALQDQIRNYDVSRTSTTTVQRAPRLKRLSVAVLLDGVNGKPRPDAEVTRLGELAKRAVGFDAQRGDDLDISSAPFARAEDAVPAPVTAPSLASKLMTRPWLIGIGALALLLLIVMVMMMYRRAAAKRAAVLRLASQPQLIAGARVADIEARFGAAGALPARSQEAQVAVDGKPTSDAPALAEPQDPKEALRDHAKELVAKDPARAASVLKIWMTEGAPDA